MLVGQLVVVVFVEREVFFVLGVGCDLGWLGYFPPIPWDSLGFIGIRVDPHFLHVLVLITLGDINKWLRHVLYDF